MEKERFTVLQFEQKKSEGRENSKDLVSESKLKHIENQSVQLIELESSPVFATFVFRFFDGKEEWDIPFELEIILDTLIAEFNGEDLPDRIRLKASNLMEQVVDSLRFQHRDKYWSIGHYYIPSVKEYHLRNDINYPIQFQNEWKRIFNLTKVGDMDEMDMLFYEAEDVHDLMLLIVGEDGKILCDYLEAQGYITYKEVAENGYEIELKGASSGVDVLNQKTIFAREVARYGYNIWVDFME